MTKLAFIGAGSTIFMKNIVGDMLHFPSLADAQISLMDIDPVRLEESALVARKMIQTMGASATVEATTDRARALDGADFVVTAFQIGGYRPSTVIDFDIPRKYGLRQTIADTLGVGGIMRGLRTVPHLWAVAEDMARLCPNALLMQYVNPMAINTWALAERYPHVNQAGLCHSVQNTVEEMAHDLDLPVEEIRHRVAGINHVAFFLKLEHQGRDLYPALQDGYRAGRLPKAPLMNLRCPNKVRYEVMEHLGYFCTESSEHFAEYVPWFIKDGRGDLIEEFGIPLDEYPKRCEEQMADWSAQAESYRAAETVQVSKSHEFAAEIMNAMVTDSLITITANLPNRGQVPQLPNGAAVETPTLVDGNGLQPTLIDDIPPQLTALMRTQINVQELVVKALTEENREHIYHAAYMDPHTAAELDLRQIRSLVDDLIAAHGAMLPDWCRDRRAA
ncbi:alpha-galactosidase [Roseobacter sp. HKCCD9010]|uniref:alpha-glucosidase/alpha-galactosidase n=1 Tax=unclassified Roseobacter TaxID=196798 RepID=UPI0019DB6185|nr:MULTISPECIES: alpha-glucosidase/alpha-galactosidase [unclassified Roseobacter]MBF9048786.1 alpha-galactosidase [Rhodobacterales bacterium HKCCD4356]NNV10785.1 alpha-galactosidase [Roseobacter sp. HKCCD7357]NNV14970.1 alpha-galactosidase [Roseobacter sp. HKCCD8768]NNV24429.1 alpha-galactosidase [Roseobacter sp. HKCCD8192]NNV28686.1 alpha-galactosidase [Roseobacter sp. HKCCD9061]